MALEKLKDKLSSITGGEVLGEASSGRKDEGYREGKSNRSKAKKPTKKAKNTKGEPVHKRATAFFRSNKEENEEEYISGNENDEPKQKYPKGPPKKQKKKEEDESNSYNIRQEGAEEGYEDVLDLLGISEKLKVDVDFKSGHLDYVEFSQTKPVGFDFDEVTDFISRVKYTMYKLETALKERERNVIELASEVKKVENRMVQENHDREMERMVGGQTEEERLIEENMDLKVEINDLRRRLEESAKSESSVNTLNREFDKLKAENEVLKENQGLQKSTDSLPGLPSLDMGDEGSEVDPIDDLFEEMGGMK